ncbi:MAG: AAA family ATPase [Deltaproteobacteria bacterium]|nr:AAA family ATPase [Deltaproteobacteria bacterium]
MNENTIDSEILGRDAQMLSAILAEMSKVIVGQQHMTRTLLMGLLANGHVLLEGLPGLAKTLAVKTLARVLDAKFSRIQFTPDLLPSDLIGTMVYREQTGEFIPKKGPIFAHIVLADEINRAPAKVQSALLEAMGEKQVTIGDATHALEEPFLVLATQNPIEQEGTYNLPEAQLDRFMFKIKVPYPSRAEERVILDRMSGENLPRTEAIFSTRGILEVRSRLDKVYMDNRIKEYILALVMASRKSNELENREIAGPHLEEIRHAIAIGASPRATLFLCRASKAHALLENRSYVIPEDVKAIAHEVLRHRLLLTIEAEARNQNPDQIVGYLLVTISVP